MFVPIQIDAQDLAIEFSLSNLQVDDMLEFVVGEVTASFAREWDAYARRELNSTRDMYRRNLIVGDEGRFTGYRIVTGKIR